MMRYIARIATLFLMVIASAGCGDYSTAAGGPYTPPPDTSFADGLWTISGSEPAIFRLGSSQLQSSGDVTPATSITTSSAALRGFNGVAFDAEGTLWITSQNDSLLLAFRRSTLATSGVRIASRVIASANGSLSGPTALAFDASHRLWVANIHNGTIVRFDSAQLASGGSPTPSVILSGLRHPAGLAFDANGALWFSEGDAHRLASFSVAQLDSSGFILPHVVLTSIGPDISNPSGLAFDSAGNLWIANSGRQNVVALRPNQLDTTALVHPAVVLSPTATFPSLPEGLAFDAQGNLWVVYAEGVLTKYDHAALAATGAPTPAVRLVINDHLTFWSPAFWPKPAGLPLQ